MFFFAVLFGGTPGRAERNEPKIPDALDALDFGVSGRPVVARGNAVDCGFSQFRVQRFPDSGRPDFRARGLLSTKGDSKSY